MATGPIDMKIAGISEQRAQARLITLKRPNGWEFIPEQVATHHHDEHEVVCFHGRNPDDPLDPCGEAHSYVEGRKMIRTKSPLVYAPAGKH